MVVAHLIFISCCVCFAVAQCIECTACKGTSDYLYYNVVLDPQLHARIEREVDAFATKICNALQNSNLTYGINVTQVRLYNRTHPTPSAST